MALFEDGTVLARYTILGKLATGGMAEVYLARQSGPSGFSKLLVLKVILPHLAEDPEFLNMFHNEAKLAALLNHPNVVQIFDFGKEQHEDEAVQYMAMEYIDGLNLRAIVKALEGQGAAVPRPIVIRLVSDACSALEYAHSLTGPEGNNLEVIHRDVSLANILLTYTGQVKLVDFGIAKASHLESHTCQGALRGKYRYMAPEYLRGGLVDQRADIYSLGVVLYRMLTGKLPFEGDNHAQLIDRIANRPPPRPTAYCPDLPEELERITLKALEKDPDQRYQRAGELQIELEAHLLASGQAVMPYNLTRFMEETFPPGEDELRVRYQRLAGIASRTPPQQRRPDDEEPGTGPIPTVMELDPPPARMTQATLKDPSTGPLPEVTEQPPPSARMTQVTLKDPPTGPLPQVSMGGLAGEPEDFKSTLIHVEDEVPAAARATLQDALDNTATDPVNRGEGLSEQETYELPGEDRRDILVAAKETQVLDIDDIIAEQVDGASSGNLPAGGEDAGRMASPGEKPADDGLDELPTRLRPTERVAPISTTRSPAIWIALVLFLVAGGGIAAYFALTQGDRRSAAAPPASRPADAAPVAPDVPMPDLAAVAPDSPAPDVGEATTDQAPPDSAPPDMATASPDLAPPDRAALTPDMPPPSPDAAPATRPVAGQAKLSVTCPLGGDVLFKGKRLGKAPLRDHEVPSGRGRLVLRSRKHHFSITRNLNLSPGAHQRLQLSPGKGTIKILVRPWAKVTLDGKALGTTPLAPVEAYEGSHQLLLVNDKLGVKKRERVTVRPGKESVVKVRLEK